MRYAAASCLFVSLWSFATAQGLDPCEGIEPASSQRIELALVHPLLNRPLAVRAPRGDDERIFIVEQGGLVRILRLANNALEADPFLTLSSRVGEAEGERGLLALAFHPDYLENGEFFVLYTESPSGRSVVSAFSVSADDPDQADATSERILLTVDQPFADHNGGGLAFDPEGYLYVALGDGGGEGDPEGRAQNPASLLGKILRLDVDRRDEGLEYAIPPDNPFVGQAPRDEIWALGLRHPWGFAIDRETGDLYIPDVGESAREELNVVAAGSGGGFNFGWSRLEGSRDFDRGAILTFGIPREPTFEYSHSAGQLAGCAIIGGAVYRGCALPDLRGVYFFADWCESWVRSARLTADELAENRDRTIELNSSLGINRLEQIAGFGEDNRGELYICDLSGKLFRVVPRTRNLEPIAVIRTDPEPPQLILEEDVVGLRLDARESTDGDEGLQDLTYSWSLLEGVPFGSFIEEPAAVSTAVEFRAPGVYRFRLLVDDGEAEDEATVEVLVVGASATRFRRGDANLDGASDLSDGISILQFLFVGGELLCRDAADSDDSGGIDLTDAVFIFNYLFLGGREASAPGPFDCGIDPTADVLPDCEVDACP